MQHSLYTALRLSEPRMKIDCSPLAGESYTAIISPWAYKIENQGIFFQQCPLHDVPSIKERSSKHNSSTYLYVLFVKEWWIRSSYYSILQIEKAQRGRQAQQGPESHPSSPKKKGKDNFLSRMKLDLEDRKHRLKVKFFLHRAFQYLQPAVHRFTDGRRE